MALPPALPLKLPTVLEASGFLALPVQILAIDHLEVLVELKNQNQHAAPQS